MKFGYFANSNSLHLETDIAQVLDETREVSIACEEAGWDVIWFPEHHFGHEGYEIIPNALMMGADIAARTSRIRIGQAANIITFWHPIRLAEDIALLDQMTRGRVELGLGRGIYHRESVHLNEAADVRDDEQNRALFDETYEVLIKALTNKFFSHEGRFYRFPEQGIHWDHALSPKSPQFIDLESNEITKLSIVPGPFQKPHPPIWQVVDTPRSIKAAGAKAINGIMWQPTVEELKGRFEMYREARSEAEGRELALGEGMALLRDLYVAETMEDAQRQASAAVLSYFHWTCHWRGLGNMLYPGEPLPPGGKLDPTTPGGTLDALTYDWLHPRNLLFGTPDYVAEKITELQEELNLQHLLLWSNQPGQSHANVMRSLELFNTEVLPRFKKPDAQASAAQ